MKIKESIGIDISRDKIDAHLFVCGEYRQFTNSSKGFAAMVRWAEKTTGLRISQIMICFEHTGLYSLPLACYLAEKHIEFAMVPALEIKKSLGIARGKNDRVDSRRIAEYAYLRREFIKPFVLPSKNVLKLQKLTSLRARIMKQKAGYQGSLKELKRFLSKSENRLLFQSQEDIVTQMTDQIKSIDNEIKTIIEHDKQMNHLSKLLNSIKGLGPVIIANLIVTTNCFTSFKDGRKYACYAGVAPFEKQSGKSTKSRSRVSHVANKNIKSLLYLAAATAVKSDPELKAYYNRRLEMGKSKMSTLNIIKNKLIHRAFAVVKRGTPYVPLYKYAA